MMVSSKSIREPLFRLRSYLSGGGLGRRYTGDEPPLRSELFSADQTGAAWQDPGGLAPVEPRASSGPAAKAVG